MTSRPGFTLIEMLVTLAVMGVVFLVVGMAIHEPAAATDEDAAAIVAATRAKAVASGFPQTAVVSENDTARMLVALPDGRVIAEAILRVDPQTGRSERHAP